MHSSLADIPGVILPWRGACGAPLRRDMSLIREILLAVEAGGGGARDFSAWSDAAVRHHTLLMIEGGLLTGRADGSRVIISHITWAGHDFLGAVRTDAIWRHVLGKISEAGGGLAFETIKHLALTPTP